MNMNDRELRETKSNEAYYLLTKQWATDEYLSKFDYPDYYAGAYLNKDGILTVLTTADDIPEIQKMIYDIADADDIIIKKAERSYNDLQKMMKIIGEYAADHDEITFAGLYDDKNSITVGFEECCPEIINTFKKQVLDTPYIKFEQREKVNNCNLNPGRGIYGNTTLATASAGYRAKRAGVNGIVVAAHSITQGATLRLGSASGSTLGSCTHRSYNNEGTVDAAFCSITNGSYPPSNTTLYGGYSLTTLSFTPAVGTTLIFEGRTATRAIGRTISSINTYIKSDQDGITTYDIIETSAASSASGNVQAGDSGGPAFTAAGATVGIVKGSASNRDYFIKATNINSALSLTRY